MINIVSNLVSFDVSYLKNCQLWIQADKINQPLGSQINFVKDFSLRENDMRVLNTGPTKTPSLTRLRVCPLPCIDMSVGTASTLVSTKNVIITRGTTICIVFATGNNATSLQTNSVSFLSTVAGGVQINVDGRVGGNIQLVQQSVVLLGNYTTSAPAWPILLGKIYMATFTLTDNTTGNQTFSVYMNGALMGTPLATSNTLFTPGSFTLGANDWGYVWELMVFNACLPRSEAEKIERYFNRKYGLPYLST